MRIFKDLELVEQLGSGIPRILRSYGKECFYFSENFLRMVFRSLEPYDEEDTTHVNTHVEQLISVLENDISRIKLQEKMGLGNRENFRKNYLIPALERGLIEMTIADKPKNIQQKYRLTALGKTVKQDLSK